MDICLCSREDTLEYDHQEVPVFHGKVTPSMGAIFLSMDSEVLPMGTMQHIMYATWSSTNRLGSAFIDTYAMID